MGILEYFDKCIYLKKMIVGFVNVRCMIVILHTVNTYFEYQIVLIYDRCFYFILDMYMITYRRVNRN